MRTTSGVTLPFDAPPVYFFCAPTIFACFIISLYELNDLDRQISLKAVAVICGSLSNLEIGHLEVCSFGEETSLVIPFNEPFTLTSGSRIIIHFTFEDTSTDI